MSRIAFIGGGGFAKEVQEIAELCGHSVVGYVAQQPGALKSEYWGTLEESLLQRRDSFDYVALAFGAVDRNGLQRRAEVVRWILEQGLASVALVSPRAVISNGVVVETGAIVAHGVVASVDSQIGAFSVLNTSAIIGHDAKIGSNVIAAPGCFVGGNAIIGESTLLGPGCLVLEGRRVGARTIVGLGASVVRDVAEERTVMPLLSKVLK